jgi:glyoxylase-like metal-dependent hydrolase (beta-lactamase superfamily II)
MRVHHLNCGTLCPRGARLINGEGGLFAPGKSVCHCLLIEADGGLVLLDTGFGTEDVRNPSQLGPIFKMMRPRTEMGETAVKQIEALGFAAEDVRQIVTTHLDPDHSGGLPDFPQAEVHVFGPELDAALDPALRDKPRYLGAHWKHNPNWVRHEVEGDEWLGFEGVRILPDLGAEVLLIPLTGHSRGHTGIAIKVGDRWLLHCGDAYFSYREVETPASCPPMLRVFQTLLSSDNKARRANQERLRELVTAHGNEVDLLCSHDPFELERAQAAGVTVAE